MLQSTLFIQDSSWRTWWGTPCSWWVCSYTKLSIMSSSFSEPSCLLAGMLKMVSYILWKNVPQVRPRGSLKPCRDLWLCAHIVMFRRCREQLRLATLRYIRAWRACRGSTSSTATRRSRARWPETKPWRGGCGTSARSWLKPKVVTVGDERCTQSLLSSTISWDYKWWERDLIIYIYIYI